MEARRRSAAADERRLVRLPPPPAPANEARLARQPGAAAAAAISSAIGLHSGAEARRVAAEARRVALLPALLALDLRWLAVPASSVSAAAASRLRRIAIESAETVERRGRADGRSCTGAAKSIASHPPAVMRRSVPAPG